MGKPRKDRTTEEWATYGHYLLEMLGKKHKLYKEIAGLLEKLNDKNDDIKKTDITHKLNIKKNELKDIWRKWTQKIKQIQNDAKRNKIYIKDSSFDNILKFICITHEEKEKRKISDNDVFKILFNNIESYGIKNTNEMLDLIDELNKFATATSQRNSNDKLTSNEGYQGETNKIIHKILIELKKHRITNFEKLKNIRKTINNDLKVENEFLTKENEKLKIEIEELKKEL